MNTIRVLLVEDHHLVRAGFKALLGRFNYVEVVAEASDGRQALDQISESQPDVVLMDISMPWLNGVEATRRIAMEYPGVRVIMLSMYASEEYVLQSLKAGAVGYLLKDSEPAEFEKAIQVVSDGETYLCSGVAHLALNYAQRTKTGVDETENLNNPYTDLTSRQREVLQLVAEGNTSLQIAERLDISVRTVERHRADIMERLNINDLPGLVRYALRVGIIGLDE
jgi:DNA-binding NarL/FixJ family response regulator